MVRYFRTMLENCVNSFLLQNDEKIIRNNKTNEKRWQNVFICYIIIINVACCYITNVGLTFL